MFLIEHSLLVLRQCIQRLIPKHDDQLCQSMVKQVRLFLRRDERWHSLTSVLNFALPFGPYLSLRIMEAIT